MTRSSLCVVTGSRADYGLLRPLVRSIDQSDLFGLKLAVTGMHLSKQFGLTVAVIERDGFPIDARIETFDDGFAASGVEIGQAMARGTAGFADYFERSRPDLLIVLGDRFEILAAAVAALPAGIPIAHLCGGDVTEGAYDDSIRHALTKLSHLHFVTNAEARARVIQLGEDPERVHLVGSTGIESLLEQDLLNRTELAERLQLDAERPWLLVTFHPVTRDALPSLDQVEELLAALDDFIDRYEIVITQPNADNDGTALTTRFVQWCTGRDHAQLHASLGQQLYASMMAEAAAMVGNSSSGLYEAPTLDCPVINIGIRQKGRPRADSTIDCPPERRAIAQAIERAVAMGRTASTNPYGDGTATARIMAILSDVANFSQLLAKSFHDLENVR